MAQFFTEESCVSQLSIDFDPSLSILTPSIATFQQDQQQQQPNLTRKHHDGHTIRCNDSSWGMDAGNRPVDSISNCVPSIVDASTPNETTTTSTATPNNEASPQPLCRTHRLASQRGCNNSVDGNNAPCFQHGSTRNCRNLVLQSLLLYRSRLVRDELSRCLVYHFAQHQSQDQAKNL